MLTKSLAKVSKEFTKEKHKAAAATRGGGYIRLSSGQYDRLRQERDEKKKLEAVIKDAAYAVMKDAYLAASANGTLPANARQIMYAARPLVMLRTGGKCWEESSYFTQTLLPDYVAAHLDETADWDVVYDARGHFAEPHVRKRLGLGTLEVRSYVNSWHSNVNADLNLELDDLYPTKGPASRYNFALFVEKEGFDALLERSGIARRYDLAIFSSKGMSTTATLMLVDRLSEARVTILIAHDFDLPGLTIAYTLCHDSRRYEFQSAPAVIDIGLRLADVQAMNLQNEPVTYKQKKDPRDKFHDWDKDYDATDEEFDFLVEKEVAGKLWRGQRVELNAMTSDQFIAWLEDKLTKAGVTKVVPDQKTLGAAWQRAQLLARIAEAAAEFQQNPDYKPAPKSLERKVRAMLKTEPELSWDAALARIARES
jgi:Protein of unknown function C-terminus (DUF2399)